MRLELECIKLGMKVGNREGYVMENEIAGVEFGEFDRFVLRNFDREKCISIAKEVAVERQEWHDRAGDWCPAQGQHKSGKSLRSAPVGLRTKMWTCSSSRASRKIEETLFTEYNLLLPSTSSPLSSDVILSTVRDTFQSSSALSFNTLMEL